MLILAIETSCDDTAIAILKTKENKKSPVFSPLSNIVSSQIETHKKYGGVYPAMAKREHQKNLVSALKLALSKAGMLKNYKKISNFKLKTLNTILKRESELLKRIVPFLKKYKKPNANLIAVTNGPGLESCLWVGVNFAKALSHYWSIPIVTINHIEAHILVNFLDPKLNPKININLGNNCAVAQLLPRFYPNPNPNKIFPAICLVVSGGHTQLILMEKIGKYRILGETRDDAAGECLDKCAKILGLGYPGGPGIAKLASQFKPGANFAKAKFGAPVKLPRPMLNTKDYDFSFSGLKTAVLYKTKKDGEKTKNKKYKKEIAAEIQQAIIDVLIKKTIKAAKNYKSKAVILGGGVSANKELRKQLLEKIKRELPGAQFLIPGIRLSTDNALMTAVAGFYRKNKKQSWQKIRAKANLRISNNV